MTQKVWRLLAKRIIRFPLSVAVALLIFNAIGVGADQQIIPDWALLKTTQQECNCLYGPTAVPTNPGGGGGGGPTPTPAPPPLATGGFGTASWGGSPPPSAQYYYANVAASGGLGTCPDPENPDYVANIKALMNTGRTLNPFWFLRSLEWAQNTPTCSSSPPTDATNWGIWQAQQFVNAIDDPQFNVNGNPPPPYWSAVFADVEVLTINGCDQSTDPTQCAGPKNAGYWYFDATHQAENVQVVSGFMTQLCSVDHFCYNGVYSSSYAWGNITGNAGPSAIGNALLVWLGSMQASPAQLNAQQHVFTQQAYYIYSWQYATNDSNLPTDCGVAGTPGPSYAAAQGEATNVSPWIGRFDVWTNGSPNKVC